MPGARRLLRERNRSEITIIARFAAEPTNLVLSIIHRFKTNWHIPAKGKAPTAGSAKRLISAMMQGTNQGRDRAIQWLVNCKYWWTFQLASTQPNTGQAEYTDDQVRNNRNGNIGWNRRKMAGHQRINQKGLIISKRDHYSQKKLIGRYRTHYLKLVGMSLNPVNKFTGVVKRWVRISSTNTSSNHFPFRAPIQPITKPSIPTKSFHQITETVPKKPRTLLLRVGPYKLLSFDVRPDTSSLVKAYPVHPHGRFLGYRTVPSPHSTCFTHKLSVAALQLDHRRVRDAFDPKRVAIMRSRDGLYELRGYFLGVHRLPAPRVNPVPSLSNLRALRHRNCLLQLISKHVKSPRSSVDLFFFFIISSSCPESLP
ncbi:hypothetical protein B0H11DRAFT_2185563 [Mycena galericulata]|nr:hypothetical protein B0H11DRAFT_2185563 [Mycena galericulata]